jgi:hypothetical protein
LQSLLTEVEQRIQTVAQDARVLDRLELELKTWQEGFRRELQEQQLALSNILFRLEQRALAFLDETVALSNVFSLLTNREGTKARFEKVVVGELSRDVDRQLNATVDWMLERR